MNDIRQELWKDVYMAAIQGVRYDTLQTANLAIADFDKTFGSPPAKQKLRPPSEPPAETADGTPFVLCFFTRDVAPAVGVWVEGWCDVTGESFAYKVAGWLPIPEVES